MDLEQSFDIGGKFSFELIRDGKVIDQWTEKNVVTFEGLNHLLNVHLGATAKVATWYMPLFEGNYTPTTGVTAATFAATATESTAYAAATRPAFVPAAAASQQITNTANKATFVINATKTMYGTGLISDSAKSGVAGVLFAATRFGTPREVIADDQLLVTYTVEAANPA